MMGSRQEDGQIQSDVIIIGDGLAGLVAANEVIARGKTVTILDQEGHQNLGGLLMIDIL